MILGTLVGVFLTTAGIILAADTAVTGLKGGAPLTPEMKIARTGPRSGAALLGAFWWSSGPVRADFMTVFRRHSEQLERDGGVSLDRQLERLLTALHREAVTNIIPNLLQHYPDRVVLRVIVVGYDGTTPYRREGQVGLDPRGNLQLARGDKTRLDTPPCFRVMAADGVIDMALDLLLDPQSGEPSLSGMRGLVERPCRLPSADATRAFFQTAVNEAEAKASLLNIPPGSVGGDHLDFMTITETAPPTIEPEPRRLGTIQGRLE